MPRYFFNVHDDADYPDLHGQELPNLNAARVEAVRFSGQLLKDRAKDFWDAKEWSMEVCDDAGIVLFTLRFSAVEMPEASRVIYLPERS